MNRPLPALLLALTAIAALYGQTEAQLPQPEKGDTGQKFSLIQTGEGKRTDKKNIFARTENFVPLQPVGKAFSDSSFLQSADLLTTLSDLTPMTALIGVGAPVALFDLFHFKQDGDMRSMRHYYAPGHKYGYDDVLMFAPIAATWGMYLGGVKGRSDTFLEAITAQGIAIALETGLVLGGKKLTARMRPDGSAANSFPSGHTAFAFASAAILDAEYGAEYPWLSLMGYTAATVTGVARILNNRHWATDVVTGAGVGLGSAWIGYYISDLIFRKERPGGGFLTSRDDAPWMFGIEKGFQSYLSSEGTYTPDRTGAYTGLSVRIPLYKGWGVKAQGTLLESRNAEKGTNLQGYLFLVKADYMHPFRDGRIWIDASAGLGYGSEVRLVTGDGAYETAAPLMAGSMPLSVGVGATVSLLPHFGTRLGADYLFSPTALPYARDSKKGLSGAALTLSLHYLPPR